MTIEKGRADLWAGIKRGLRSCSFLIWRTMIRTPRLLLEGEGIHAGQGFTALFPDGWHDITLEVAWETEGPGCWYISTPGFKGVCPVGLFVKV